MQAEPDSSHPPRSVKELVSTELLMVEDVAARLRTGRNYVYRRIEDGTLKALNIGTAARPKFRITEAQLQAFIDSHGQSPELT